MLHHERYHFYNSRESSERACPALSGLRATRMIKATNVIYHDKAHPSALLVPLVPLTLPGQTNWNSFLGLAQRIRPCATIEA